ncbi:preprotein translocase subunit SecA [bacterium CG10_46_32]|nr:MAG: preprotein translocase subunit SecA [bacterium CG10_46_32]PIR55760.1 MAG: preprotein translocase subunit SecA [Parcubacteria group bacterium CG10_big_fil_rev_8_21_14_0_10_46_32]
MTFLDKLLGDPGDRHIKKKLKPVSEKINALESVFEKKTDQELAACTEQFKKRIADGESLDGIVQEAFAVVREASKRTLGMRHFDVQLIGGMVLHQGAISEMRTGEGKTLVATLPVYLNALTGKGVHVVTVNDYLARRDAVWMAKVYNLLGLSIGVIQHEKSYLYDPGVTADTEQEEKELLTVSPMVKIDYDHLRPVERREAYQADITYGTNNEFGFDYLRDNMVARAEQMVQRDFNFAIVDEVDSILIDEARTPLIISAPDDRPVDQYYRYAGLIKNLIENEDYNVDEKMRAATLTEAGIKKMERSLGMENIYTEGGLSVVHHLEQSLKARTLFEKDRDYVVAEGEVVIVDEFTGRMMSGRRYSEGLHQAIEAKEGVEIKRESRTLATITFQNYFRLYPKLSGMTGTAKTEEEEFRKIYGLDVFVIPTNKPIMRLDLGDRVYKSKKGKYDALIAEIKNRNKAGQPMLIGTISIEQNEEFAELLGKAGVKHEILNAKNHEREAEIISLAGRVGAVTLATNMAGRGVDIVLGGMPYDASKADEVKKLGGLHVLGTERHEARRIDNQLRGRSGRQGDPGSSQFFISVDDDLMRIFGSDRIKNMMNRLGVPEDMPIENKMVSRSIESAQKKVEGNNFDIRKHVVEYDDVANRHREAIYKRRKSILKAESEEDLGDQIFEMIDAEIVQVVNLHTSASNQDEWNLTEIEQTVATIFPPDTALDIKEAASSGDREKLIEYLQGKAESVYQEAAKVINDEQQLKQIEAGVLLNSIDTLWMDHLDALDNLRTAVGLRGYGQRDPLVEYKRDAYGLFKQLLSSVQNQVVYSIYKVLAARSMQIQGASSPEQAQKLLNSFGSSLSALRGLRFSAPAKEMSEKTERPGQQSSQSGTRFLQQATTASSSLASPDRNRFSGEKVGRNDVCPCGSGKKFKKCHGK